MISFERVGIELGLQEVRADIRPQMEMLDSWDSSLVPRPFGNEHKRRKHELLIRYHTTILGRDQTGRTIALGTMHYSRGGKTRWGEPNRNLEPGGK
ncbi:hypothetical protein NPIL_630061 [Nephila pilipes]|uniref:Uncharacterized protein n=1 Tax=Nephila pilipes TaxID=299642 RepID=A0A8X6R577_NEPPI|nr:hypothetical protein NPIL_630061 [Nephila pilipes]